MPPKQKRAVIANNPSSLRDLGDAVMCNKDLVYRILSEMFLLCFSRADKASMPNAPGSDLTAEEAWTYIVGLRKEFSHFILDVTNFCKVNACAAVEANLFLSTWRDKLACNLILKNDMLIEARSKRPQSQWDAPSSWRPPLATSAITGFCAMTEEVLYFDTVSSEFPKNHLISTNVHLENLSSVLIPAEQQTLFAMMNGLCMCCSTQIGSGDKRRLCRKCHFLPNAEGDYYAQACFMHPYNLYCDAYEDHGDRVQPWYSCIPFTNGTHMVTIRIHCWKTTPYTLWKSGPPGRDLVSMYHKKAGLWIAVPSLEDMQNKDNNDKDAKVRVFGVQISHLGQRRNSSEARVQHMLRCLATLHNHEFFLCIKRLFYARIMSESIAVGKRHAKMATPDTQNSVYIHKKGEYEANQHQKDFRTVCFAVPLLPLEHVAKYAYMPYLEFVDDNGNSIHPKRKKVDIVTDGSIESIFLGKVTPGSSLDHGFTLTDLIESGRLLSEVQTQALAEEAEQFRREELERRTRLLLWFDHARWKTTFTASTSETHLEGLHDVVKCWTFGSQTPTPGDVMTMANPYPTNQGRVEMLLRIKQIRDVYDFEKATVQQQSIMSSPSMAPYLNSNAEEEVKTMARALLILRPFGYPDSIPEWLQNNKYNIKSALLQFVRTYLTKTHEMYTRVHAERVFGDVPAYVPNSDLSGFQILKVDSPDAHISTWLQVLIHRAPPNKATQWPLQLHVDRVYCPYDRQSFTRDKDVSRYATRVLFKLQSGESHVLYGNLTISGLHNLFMTEARAMEELKTARQMSKEYRDLQALAPGASSSFNLEQWLQKTKQGCAALNTWLSQNDEQARERQRPIAFFKQLMLEDWNMPGGSSAIGLIHLARCHEVTLRRYNPKKALPPGARVVTNTRRQKKHVHYDPPRKLVPTADHKVQSFCENQGYELCVCSKKCTFSGDRPKQCVFGRDKAKQSNLNTFLSTE